MAVIAGSFFEGIALRDRLIGLGIILSPLLLLIALAMIFLHPKAIQRSAVYGCYLNPNAPSLKVASDGMEIMEPERRRLSYVAEPDKEGYRLSVSPALGLTPAGEGRYAFKPERGIGYFWPLLTKSSSDPKALRDPGNFGGRFQVIAQDGVTVIYSRSSDQRACQ